ncbi:hypothetical protein [Amycolatopsis sp. NPDC054798]
MADLLAGRGAGLVLEHEQVSAGQSRAQLVRLIEEPSFAESAEKVRPQVLEVPVPARIVPELERLAGIRERRLRPGVYAGNVKNHRQDATAAERFADKNQQVGAQPGLLADLVGSARRSAVTEPCTTWRLASGACQGHVPRLREQLRVRRAALVSVFRAEASAPVIPVHGPAP